MRIRKHRSTCISNGKAPHSFQTLMMADASPLPKPYAESSATSENLHHQGCPQSYSETLRILDVTQKSLGKSDAHVGCSNRVVAASELQDVLPPIRGSKPLFSNDNRAASMGIQAVGNEATDKFRVCTVNMSPWDVPSFFDAFHTDSTPSQDHINNPKRKSEITVVKKKKQSNAKQYSKPNKPASTRDELNKPKTLRSVDRVETIDAQAKFKRKDKFAKLEVEDAMIESALKNVLSECGGGGLGLTVREAACKVLLFHKYNSDIVNKNRKVCGGLPLTVVVRRVMLNSPFFVELNSGRFALWDDFLKTRTLPDNIGSQKLNVDREGNRCNEHEKDEIQKGVVPSSPRFDNTKRKRSSRKLGSTIVEYNTMETISNMTMKQSDGDECEDTDPTKFRKLKSYEGSSDCKRTSENNKEEEEILATSKTKGQTEKWVDDNELLWLMLCDGEGKRDSAQQSYSKKKNKRKAVKARSLKALVETF